MQKNELLEKVLNELPETIRFAENRGYGGLAYVIRDAFELLKEQRPRVMTIDEVKQMGLENARNFELKKTCVMEYKTRKHMYTVEPEWAKWDDTVEFFRFYTTETEEYRIDRYGMSVRCWTSEPTDAQREAAKWVDWE